MKSNLSLMVPSMSYDQPSLWMSSSLWSIARDGYAGSELGVKDGDIILWRQFGLSRSIVASPESGILSVLQKMLAKPKPC